MKKYEIISHGMERSDYFQGCGVSFTSFDHCITGIGSNEKEAYEDAVEQVYKVDDNADALRLPTRPRGIRSRPTVPASSEDLYFYVSIRWRD